MWIEDLCGDMNKHGFDLDCTHLRHFLRLSHLTLVVYLLSLWFMAMGEDGLAHHLASQGDRSNRRELSIVRLGWHFLEDCLRLFDPIPSVTTPNFCSVSGG